MTRTISLLTAAALIALTGCADMIREAGDASPQSPNFIFETTRSDLAAARAYCAARGRPAHVASYLADGHFWFVGRWSSESAGLGGSDRVPECQS